MMNLIDDRNRDFMARCHEIASHWGENKPPTRNDIIHRALMSQAPGYYVTFDHAFRSLSKLKIGKLPDNITPLKRQMWNEIYAKVLHYQKSHPLATTTDALTIVLTHKASRFFISPSYAIRLFYHLNNPYEAHKKHSTRTLCNPHGNIMLNNPTITHSHRHRNAC